MKPRRALIFSHAYYPRPVAGAEVAVKEITDRILPGDIEFDMITINGGDLAAEEKIGNVTIHRLFNKFGVVQKFVFPFAAYFKARELHRNKKYDMVWSIMASYAGFAGFLFKRKYKDVPFVLTIQEGEHFERRVGIFASLFRRIFKAADQITVLSAFLADWSRRMGATCPITVIPNGVDFEKFSRPIPPDQRAAIRRELGLSENDIVLVTASRLVYKNATDDIISALKSLDGSYKALILGTGHDESALREQARNLKLEGRVIFKGFVPHADLPRYLQAADIFVRPSRSEGLGNSFLEAMAAGIPVIATPVGGIPDFLTDGEIGLFCEVDNPRSIAQKAEKLVKDRESRNYIVGRAREMVRQKYGWDNIAVEMQSILLK